MRVTPNWKLRLIPMAKKKGLLTYEQYRLQKAILTNPLQVELVQAIESYQDSGAGKKAMRVRSVAGGKVQGILLVRFEDIDACRGQWTPAVIYWKAEDDTAHTLIEKIEEKGCELEPEVRKTEDAGEGEEEDEDSNE